ncbi:hypothetical protein [uncultured Paraglaciecola sp.]|jgi:hypothetical protein|uniref:hypothetical protein n=1 Tax=uncultured Paraglaciecola sp. TaxID=1765024 RepID=UPI0025E18F48|nr:hypothetical protein [uncultured Paraglaciecola sp.]
MPKLTTQNKIIKTNNPSKNINRQNIQFSKPDTRVGNPDKPDTRDSNPGTILGMFETK